MKEAWNHTMALFGTIIVTAFGVGLIGNLLIIFGLHLYGISIQEIIDEPTGTIIIKYALGTGCQLISCSIFITNFIGFIIGSIAWIYDGMMYCLKYLKKVVV